MNVQPAAAGHGAAPPAQAAQGPAAPAQQPAPPVPLVPQPAGPHTYVDYYNIADNDPYHGNYVNAMQTYHVPLANAGVVAPATLANQVYDSASTVPMSFVLLCRDPAADAATDPGKVVLFHRVSKFAARIGLPPTAWDDSAFAFTIL